MAHLDRSSLVELLDRLGAESDATVLESARTLHRTVNEAGATWDDLLRLNLDMQAEDADEELAEAPGGEDAAAESELSEAERAEAAKLIDRLLTRDSVSATLRESLRELKAGISDGSFEAMDLRYVRALARRLNP